MSLNGREVLTMPEDLPVATREVLEEFLATLTLLFGSRLQCVLLFGSAAEGRLRSTSDLNLLVMADQFAPADLEALHSPLQTGRAAAGLTVLFLETSEFVDACEAFAMKFADIKVRHRVLLGTNPFAAMEIPRQAEIRRLRQVVLNLKLRLRERYTLDSDRPERLALMVADMTGPIRVAAATLLALRDGRERSPKAALEEFCAQPRWAACLDGLSAVHRGEVPASDRIRALIADVWGLLGALVAAAATVE
jgi:predicted nucleotidyltransferase